MLDLRESVVFALLGVIIVSIPAASQNVDIEEGEYRGVIESEFSDHFKVDFDTGKVFTQAISSDSRLEIKKSFRKKVVEFQTAEGSIEKTWSNDSIVTEVQTPYGSFESGVENGENFSEYEGENQEMAEELREELRDRMDEKLSQAEEKRKIVVQRILPDVELNVEDDHDKEHFNLTNQGEDSVDLEGWRVLSEGSGKDSIQLSRELEPGETRKFTGSAGEVGFSSQDSDMTIYSGDASITLFNSDERIVDSIEH
jgi:hypothetical protein